MPKGVYDHKKRIFSAESLEKFKANLKKAREIQISNPVFAEKAKKARSRNADKASTIRSARAILRHFPLGAVAGTRFDLIGKIKSYIVIDPAPRKVSENKWEQLFTEVIHQKIGGVKKELSSTVAVVWDYEPNTENIMKLPLLEPR